MVANIPINFKIFKINSLSLVGWLLYMIIEFKAITDNSRGNPNSLVIKLKRPNGKRLYLSNNGIVFKFSASFLPMYKEYKHKMMNMMKKNK